MHRSRGAINLLWQQRLAAAGSTARATPAALMSSASPPPPPATAAAESFMNASSGTYLDEMYESWCRDPTSVHASWNAYFSGSTYTAPPTVGNTKANEVPLSAIGKYLLNLINL